MNSLIVFAHGTYTVNPTTGVISFKPVSDFTGIATPVTYRITDAYGQSVENTYSVTVTSVPVVPAVIASATAPALMKIVTQRQTMPVLCTLTVRRIGRCDVVLIYRNTRGTYVVGTGSMTSPTVGGTAGQLNTQVTLNATGHYLAGLAILPTWVYVGITPYGSRTSMSAITHTAFGNYNLK